MPGTAGLFTMIMNLYLINFCKTDGSFQQRNIQALTFEEYKTKMTENICFMKNIFVQRRKTGHNSEVVQSMISNQ